MSTVKRLPTAPAAERPPDRAVLGIVGANALTLLMALWQDWGLLGLLWPFWLQSVLIGRYARRRILALDRFSTEGLQMNGRSVDPTPKTQRQVANFFALHYGLFHFVYFVFLVVATASGGNDGILDVRNADTGEITELYVGTVGALDLLIFAVLGWSFLRTHRASHHEHVAADLARVPKIGTLMMLPYARVVPMHLTIVLGAMLGGGGALWVFVLLKTAADVAMHKVEHRWLQGETPTRSGLA